MRLTLLFSTLLVVLGLLGLAATVTQPFVAPVPSQPPAVAPARLEAHVRKLAVDLYPRSADFNENLDRAAQYIFDEMHSAGAKPEFRSFEVGESRYKNVVARFGPKDGSLLVIGAHYDSHGDAAAGARHASRSSPDTHTPGADDNASGVAGLIELARLLVAKPPSRPVELVAYTLEEPPHFRTGNMGSVWHAKGLMQTGEPVELMVSLEMIGYFKDEPGSQSYPAPGMSAMYSDRGDFIAIVGQLANFGLSRRVKGVMAGATPMPVYSINAPALIPGIDFSDHRSYWHLGLPAVMVTDTAFFRNHQYHRAGDRPETLDYGRMAQVVQAVYALTRGF